jgi:uncharacterized RDD family membrane protein YckC
MNVDDYLTIDTPENVAFGYDVAGLGSRFLAALVDTFLILILQLIVNFVLLLLVRGLLEELLPDGSDITLWLTALLSLVAFAFFWGYYIFFEMIWNGQSPGKRWVGLRVIRTDGTPITLTESIIRNLIRLVDFLPMYYGVGVVTMFINDQSRRLGDLAAGTLVVRDQATITLESLGTKSTFPVVPTLHISPRTADLPVERLSQQDIQVIEDFFRRRYELTNRRELARRLLLTLFERMSLPPPDAEGIMAEDLLAEIVQLYRKQNS